MRFCSRYSPTKGWERLSGRNKFKQRIHRNNAENTALLDRYVLPTYARTPVTLVHGEGVWVWSADGKKYLDFFGGLAVDNLGHAPPRIKKVLADQAGHLLHCSNVFTIQEQAELAEKLVTLSGMHQAFFCNSGTEAVEACIKFARYHGVKNFGAEHYEIIVAENSFHGRTLGSLSATMQKKYRDGFGPLVPGFKAVPFGDLTAASNAVGPDTCAILIEPIQGEGGVNIPPADYLPGLRKICDEKNCLLVLDEVQVGVGRTGKLFAGQHSGVVPDLMAVSKALGSGFPIGACLASKKVADSVKPGMHASTFGGNPLACRVALETLSIVARESFLKKVAETGAYFIAQLKKLQKKHSIIAEVRGLGLMIGCELNRETGVQVVKECLQEGLLINAIQGKILRFVPPLIINKGHVDRAVKILDRVLAGI
ncbi:MAG: aspartate aminotransferase family protein [Deltaproteobacteria bacterium]|nr:aspartate aminotransferase family protein [Deltaproteobacteria bacterium]